MKRDAAMNLDDIRSNGIQRCAYCGIPITPANASGWEVFVANGVTQPVCGWCDVVRSAPGPKAQPDQPTDRPLLES